MSGRIDCYGMTHVGRKRTVNEDQFLIAELNKSLCVLSTSLGLDQQSRLFGNSQGQLLVVADGMGGHEAGERASTLAVDSLVKYVLNTMPWMFNLDPDSEEDFQDELRSALEHCQTQIRAEADAIPQHEGMGTTLTMAYVIWPRAYVVHVGDSQCFLFRGRSLEQITRDHTLGQLHKESLDVQANVEPHKNGSQGNMSNVLWNVIGGGSDELHPDVYRTDLTIGDTLLLCTDGLTKQVAHERIIKFLQQDASAEQICRQLIEEANAQGGSDNITVVVARFCQKTEQPCKEVATAESIVNDAASRGSSHDTDPYIEPLKMNC